MSKLVLIEYVEDHDAYAGLASEDEKAFTIESGTKRLVDAGSAASLVKKGKAKLVVAEPEDAEPEVVEPVKAVEAKKPDADKPAEKSAPPTSANAGGAKPGEGAS